MSRETVDFGIDLGTTNSAIAVMDGMTSRIIKTSDETRMDYTPSVVWVDTKGRVRVGRAAKEALTKRPDFQSVKERFKLDMGETLEYSFANTPQRFTPEALSAEVLKALRRDVKVALGEDIDSAVITVPAAFKNPQLNATLRAAAAAGFSRSVTPLQEPVAAALAYQLDHESDNVFWLVYDLGGGTFDAAVVRVKDGDISVVNHLGDNTLGGGLLDWSIVETVLMPAIVKQEKITDLARGNDEWAVAIAKLKAAAEGAKIRLSAEETVEIEIEGLSDRLGHRTFDFNFTLRRDDIARLFDPIIDRTVRLSRETLRATKLQPDNIAKLLLVGGPTLTPYLRERLVDRNSGLGIPLEVRIDPMTVVARGAALFAGARRLGPPLSTPPRPGKFSVTLDFKPMGPDTEPPVGGRVVAGDGGSLRGYTLELINRDAEPVWRSGPIGLSPDGVFIGSLWAEKGKPNTIVLELRDPKGNACELEPNKLTYKVVAVFESPLCSQSLGVALRDNRFRVYFAKGAPLPARKLHTFSSVVEIRAGQSTILRIPIMEGEHKRADRNQPIYIMTISGSDISRTLPAGSEIDVTLEIDASSKVQARAYVPLLNQDFEVGFNEDAYRQQARDPAKLRQLFDAEIKRLEELRGRAKGAGVAAAQAAILRIDAERMIKETDDLMTAAGKDHHEANRALQHLLELGAAVDSVEDALAWPLLVADAEKELGVEREIIENPKYKAAPDEKAEFRALEADLQRAIVERDGDMVKAKQDELDRLGTKIVFRDPGWWVGQFLRLESRVGETTDPAQAQRFLEQGRRALAIPDVPALKAAVRQIAGLLPANDPDRKKIISDVTDRGS